MNRAQLEDETSEALVTVRIQRVTLGGRMTPQRNLGLFERPFELP
jgi:hypothetical protein